GYRRPPESGWVRRAGVRVQAAPGAAVATAAPAGALGSAGADSRAAAPAAPAGSAVAAGREQHPGSARAGSAGRPGAVTARVADSAGSAASAGPGKVRKPARPGARRARAAAVAEAGAERAAGDRHRVAAQVTGRVRAADARWAVRGAGTPRADSRAVPPDAAPKAARTGAGRAGSRAAHRTVAPAAAYRAGRRDGDSRAVRGAGRLDAGVVRQVARRTAGSVVVRAPGYGYRARGDAAGSRHTDRPPDAGRAPAARAGPAGEPVRPVARIGAAAVAVPGRNRDRYRAGGRSSPAPIRETEAPAPTVRWGPAGLVDRRAVYRAAADER